MNIYETSRLLDEYLLFHYGAPADILPGGSGPVEALDFAGRTVVENITPAGQTRALDVGCAVGRSAFELSRFCGEVIGIDWSQTFIDAAERLRRGETLTARRHEEGHLFTEVPVRAPCDARPGHVSFERGDAMNLRRDLGIFDIVHAANLICRLSHPECFLERLPALVAPGGRLVLTTPCTWLGEFTHPDRWPAGPTLDWLRSNLSGAFTLETVHDMPFLIREHARKFQWSVAQATTWRRRIG